MKLRDKSGTQGPASDQSFPRGLPSPTRKREKRASLRFELLFGLFFALALPLVALAEKVEELKPQGYVNDFAGVLDTGSRARLNAICAEVDQKTSAQIAVVTIHRLEGVPVEDFATRLFERWGIGPKSDNRGVLVVLAVEDRKYRVEVAYGLEPILPDGKVGGFGREMLPLLREGNYGAALLRLTAQIAHVIASDRGVQLTTLEGLPSEAPSNGRAGNPPSLLALLLLILIFGGVGLRWLLPLFVLGYAGRRRRGGWWGMGGSWVGGGSSWGGGFGGGGSFGGFGGGMSGGGGASGSW